MGHKVGVLRAPGTNCDKETANCLESLGMDARILHIKKILDRDVKFSEFDGLIIPGGFSYGDHVRAGALLGKILGERFTKELQKFSDNGKPILGICNGFQVLVECGLLPGGNRRGALTTNLSSKFECRWVDLKVEKSDCVFTRELSDSIKLPVAHGEGRFLVEPDKLKTLNSEGQITLRYARKDGESAKCVYPDNPNGSLEDIAGISDKSGIVFGLMPHPERAFHRYTHPDWTRSNESDLRGDGYKIFKNMVEYIKG
jgi:phosphoribosylformylglycinamidine synthase